MKRLRKLAAVLLLGVVMSMGAGLGRASTTELPGLSVNVSASVTANGVSETPGLMEAIIFMLTLTL